MSNTTFQALWGKSFKAAMYPLPPTPEEKTNGNKEKLLAETSKDTMTESSFLWTVDITYRGHWRPSFGAATTPLTLEPVEEIKWNQEDYSSVSTWTNCKATIAPSFVTCPLDKISRKAEEQKKLYGRAGGYSPVPYLQF